MPVLGTRSPQEPDGKPDSAFEESEAAVALRALSKYLMPKSQ